MEQDIDQFIRRDDDRDDQPEVNACPSEPADGAPDGDHGITDIVARLAPRPLDGPERLPRIVTSSLPIRPPGLAHQDHWRRQFLDALSEADDGTPMAPASPLPRYSGPASARSPLDQPEHERGRLRLGMVDEPSPFAPAWRTAQCVLVAAVATTCVLSTGVLWAKHRSEMVAETGGPPAEIAAAIPESAAIGGAAPGQSIRNRPVLIREGESLTLVPGQAATGWFQAPPVGTSKASVNAPAPILPPVINGGEPTHAVPVAPIAPVVRVVPVVPVAPHVPSAEAAVAPGPSSVDAVASPSPPLDREGLTALAARSAAPPAIHHEPTHHEPTPPKHRVAAVSTGRVSSVPFSARGPVPEVDRGQVPPTGWVQRRQGLRVEPEPEPSTLKKLIGLVWPAGKSSSTPEPPKPAPPAVTAPAVTAPAYSWSDSARANP